MPISLQFLLWSYELQLWIADTPQQNFTVWAIGNGEPSSSSMFVTSILKNYISVEPVLLYSRYVIMCSWQQKWLYFNQWDVLHCDRAISHREHFPSFYLAEMMQKGISGGASQLRKSWHRGIPLVMSQIAKNWKIRIPHFQKHFHSSDSAQRLKWNRPSSLCIFCNVLFRNNLPELIQPLKQFQRTELISQRNKCSSPIKCCNKIFTFHKVKNSRFVCSHKIQTALLNILIIISHSLNR